MNTMTSNGKRICSECAEEMDSTDQQLKPCECGYEICLWCWHHIMEIAEKNGTEGHCPACFSPYNKEKILAMTISNERKVSSKKKPKLQKEKPKLPDQRDLENVRLVIRNLVYVAGIPNRLASKEILNKKEYLGQYGKISKIFITRPAEVHHQFFPDSCIVYVTYSKKEEALQCIQSVNGFILDDYPLKACFGTSRYCHTWLKKLSCNNPNCYYVHEIVPQEDVCTKEEVALACTSKLQESSGTALNGFQQCSSQRNFQRRSGSTLPAPEGNHQRCSEKSLVLSATSKPSGYENLRSDDETSSVPSKTFPSGSTTSSGKTSYASVAVSQGRLNTSEMSNDIATPSNAAKAQSLDETRSTGRILTSGSYTEPTKGFVETFNSSRSSPDHGCHLKAVPSLKASSGNNVEMRYTSADSSRPGSSYNLSVSDSTTREDNEYPESKEKTTRESSVASRQDSLVETLQTVNISSIDVSQKVHNCQNWSSGCSELTNSADRFETEDTFSYDQEFQYIPTCDTGATNSKQLDHFSVYSAGGSGVSFSKDQTIKRNQYAAFGSKDIEAQDIRNKRSGLANQLNYPNCPAPSNDTNRRVDCLKISNPSLPVSCSDSRYSSAGIDGPTFSSRQSFPCHSDVLFPNKSYQELDIAKSKVKQNDESTIGLSFDPVRNLEVRNIRSSYPITETSIDPRHLPSLRKPGSSGSVSAALLAPKIPPVPGPSSSVSAALLAPKIPPGFYTTKHTPDRGVSCFRTLTSGTPTGSPAMTSSSLANSTSYSYFSSEPIDSLKRTSSTELLQSSTHPVLHNYRSNSSEYDILQSKAVNQFDYESLLPRYILQEMGSHPTSNSYKGSGDDLCQYNVYNGVKLPDSWF